MIIDHIERTFRGRNALINVIELWVALAGVITGIVFFYSPAAIDKNALAQTVGHGLASVWNVGYFAAGLIIWFGLLKPSPRFEISGLCLLGGATSVNGIAILTVFGLRGAATSITYFTLTIAVWIRAYWVMRAALHLAEEHDAPSG